MARRELHNVASNWTAVLETAVNNSVTSVVLSASGATGSPGVPFKFHLDSERLRCSAVAVDTPSAGLDTLTVTRGADGTSGASQSAGAVVAQKASAADFQEHISRIEALQVMVVDMLGGGEGVVRKAAGTELGVVAQGSPDMTVVFKAGAGVVSGEIGWLSVDTTSSVMVAPTVDPRIDIVQIDQDGVVSVKAGSEAGSPSAPSVDTDQLKLAEVYHRVGTVHVDDVDDASNSYITDSRVYL